MVNYNYFKIRIFDSREPFEALADGSRTIVAAYRHGNARPFRIDPKWHLGKGSLNRSQARLRAAIPHATAAVW
jgi:hypothetical protein